MQQLQDLPPGGRKLVAYLLEKWLKQKVNCYAVPLVTLGGMLRDLLPHQRGLPGCPPDEMDFARSLARGMIASLEQVISDDEMNVFRVAEVTGAVIHAAVDVASRADRRQIQDQLPIDDSWEDGLEQECGEVGHMLSQWLRRKLPSGRPNRGAVYRQVIELLRQQLTAECRHLRRLHMGFQQVQTLSLDQGQEVPTQALDGDEIDVAKDLVDQLVMIIGNVRSSPTVMEMLGAASGSRASSSSGPATLQLGTLFQESEALRRWLNEYFEGSLDTLDDTLADDLMAEGLDAEGAQTCHMEMQGQDDLVEDFESENHGSSDVEEDDELNLGQKGREKSRSRPRSRFRDRRTWSAVSARGWWAPELRVTMEMRIDHGGEGSLTTVETVTKLEIPEQGADARVIAVKAESVARVLVVEVAAMVPVVPPPGRVRAGEILKVADHADRGQCCQSPWRSMHGMFSWIWQIWTLTLPVTNMG